MREEDQTVALAVLFVIMFIGVCFFVKANQAKEFEKNDYGVFLNADASSLERFKMYETIVIDAQYFTKRDIELLHQNGTVVYTYLNIGSIENFREYYTTYAELAIGEYEHWDEEEWVDVANPDWQKFIGQLSQELYEKGVDGFFIDNCDVYYYDPPCTFPNICRNNLSYRSFVHEKFRYQNQYCSILIPDLHLS